ncbi:LAMI_0H17282g1_1 [Lachancea mirantina]|uniref:LAMI_0H17282g1_1 n=1 Tax=Lachancea mirantina TaxID=1230905 RepID=A0A1G4KJ36_9SACH|nr:LAMI_0H17282g1_1 [Lachancea mirantina]
MTNTKKQTELFPDSFNLNISSNYEEKSSNNESKISESTESSANTRVIKSILQEECDVSILAFKRKLRENRFYMTQKSDEILARNKHSKDNHNDLSDFELYNLKVQREDEFREKLKKILEEPSDQALKVLELGALGTEYTAGDENITTNRKSWVGPKNLQSLLSKVRGQKFQNVLAEELGPSPNAEYSEADSAENHTQIIDLENGNWIIEAGADILRRSIDRVLEGQDLSPSELESKGQDGKNIKWHDLRRISEFLCRDQDRKDRIFVQRKLKVRHLQMIATGATLGVGLFLNSGKALSISGPLGSLIGFCICGSIVLATMLSFTEISTLLPLSSGFSGLASRFVEDAFGFALGWSYWFSFILALPSQIVASVYMLSYFENLTMSRQVTAGFVTLFLAIAILSNLIDVRIFAEISYACTFCKVVITGVMILVMIILNVGVGRTQHAPIGFRFWDSSKSPEGLTYGAFRPTFDLRDMGTGSLDGIEGPKGRFLAVIVVVLISSFSFSGVELAFVASVEAINPRKTLPSATKRTFITIVFLYISSILMIGMNVYSGDGRLLRYYTTASADRASGIVLESLNTSWQIDGACGGGRVVSTNDFTNGNQSPWVLALQSFGLCTFSSVFNGILVFFGVSAGLSSLYASSRTLYSMSIQEKAPKVFQRCTHQGVPVLAVLFSGAFGTLAYLAVDKTALTAFQALANISSATISIIWIGLNTSFLRFFYALRRRPTIISRDDSTYPYKSPFQPFLACYGLVGSLMIVILMGFINFLNGFWSTKMFFSSYGGLMFFGLCYIGYKLFRTSKLQKLEQLDLDSGRREIDRTIWKEHTEYSGSLKERLSKFVTWMF